MYSLRKATEADLDFMCEMKKETLGSYIGEIWGWDEKYQKDDTAEGLYLHQNHIIMLEGKNIGLLQINEEDATVHIVELQILLQFQGKGIGSSILRNVVADAKREKKKTQIGCFKMNAGAKSLYLKLGFRIIAETETHLVFEQ